MGYEKILQMICLSACHVLVSRTFLLFVHQSGDNMTQVLKRKQERDNICTQNGGQRDCVNNHLFSSFVYTRV